MGQLDTVHRSPEGVVPDRTAAAGGPAAEIMATQV